MASSVSGLSSLRSKSRERCDWTFHSAACNFVEGIVHLFWTFTWKSTGQLSFSQLGLATWLLAKLMYLRSINQIIYWAHFYALNSPENIYLCPSQHRRKHKKSGLWTGSSAMLGKDLSSFLGSSTNSRTNTHESAPDPLLSPFLGNLSRSDPRQSQHDEPFNISASHSKRYSPFMTS
jgi:hypothetical protein